MSVEAAQAIADAETRTAMRVELVHTMKGR